MYNIVYTAYIVYTLQVYMQFENFCNLNIYNKLRHKVCINK